MSRLAAKGKAMPDTDNRRGLNLAAVKLTVVKANKLQLQQT
jgi:hypothetical protein